MEFLSDENLKKYKFQTTFNEEIKDKKDKTLTSFDKSKSRIGFRDTVTSKAHAGYSLKEDLLSIEQLDSLALFMRNHQLNNSENYPFYNNYDERNIGIHKGIIYKAILDGNKYNSTNIGASTDEQQVSQKIRPETFEEELNRKMKAISKSKGNIEIPNSLDIINGNNKSQKFKTFSQLPDEVEFENDLNDQDLQDGDQYVQEDEENFVKGLIDPFNEDDFDLARINNKIFDDNCWYRKDYRINHISDPSLYNEKRQYYENKRVVKRSNKEHLIYYIQTEINYNNLISLMPHQDNTKAIQSIIAEQLNYNHDILTGHVQNTLFKIDVERSTFSAEKLELQIESFGQIHLKNSEEIFICGGKANGIAQNSCMLIDFTLKKYMIKNNLAYSRYDHLLLQLDDFVYIIGGSATHGETLLSCEKYNIKSQEINQISSLELTKNFLCGTVSQLNKCLYVTGSPMIVDSYIQIQKFEPHTNFWSVLHIQVNYLALKQPKMVKMAIYDESIQKSQLYIFCQDMNKYENYCLSIHDLTGDDIRPKAKAEQKLQQQQQSKILQSNNIFSSNTNNNMQAGGLSTINSNDGTLTNFMSHANRFNNLKSPNNKTLKNPIFIQDQGQFLDISAINPLQNTKKQTKSASQLPFDRIETPRMNKFEYVPQFHDQMKLIYKNRNQYNEQLKKKLEQERKLAMDTIVGDTEQDEEILQLINKQDNPNSPIPPAPFKSPSSFKDAVSTPRVRKNSKLEVSPKNQIAISKSIFFEEQRTSLTPSKRNGSPSKKGTPSRHSNPYYYLTKQQQEKRLLDDRRKQQQKLLVMQMEEKKQKGQIVRIEQSRSDFNNLEILATRDFEVFTINKNNALHIEKFDFVTWKKDLQLLRYSAII